MHPTIAKLLSQVPVLTDGAWGTQLQARGLPTGACPDEWNLSRPDAVQAVAAAYVAAGSRIILSNTFGANRIMLKRHGLEAQTEAINRTGAQLSRRAAGGKALVFASVGPTGVVLMMGEVSEAEVEAAFHEQAVALAAGGADGLVVESFGDLAEAVLAVKGAKSAGLPVVASLVFDTGPQLDRTMMGNTPEQCARALLAAGADVVGANCGRGSDSVAAVCRRLRAAAGGPVWIKPNAGLPEVIGGQTVFKQAPAEFAAFVPGWVAAGAGFVGGCCGTTPAFIAAVVRQLSPGGQGGAPA